MTTLQGCAGYSSMNWLYDFQSLIAGILALIAALATIYFLHHQSQAALRRDHEANRANLPLALSNLLDYSDECVSCLVSVLEENTDGTDIRTDITIPSLPEFSLRVLTDLVRSSAPTDANKMQALLGYIQVHHARMRSIANGLDPQRDPAQITITANVRQRVLDANVLGGMANHLFGFARRDQKSIPDFDPDTYTPSVEYHWHTRLDQITRKLVEEKSANSIAYWFKNRGSE